MEGNGKIGIARRRATSRLINGGFAGLSRVGRALPPARLARHGVECISDVGYASAARPEHTLDIYRPIDRTTELPVVLYVHGGAFQALSKDTHWIMGLVFARRGYLVFSINYRLAPRHPFPAAIEDACAAYAWVTKNAKRWGGDPKRLVLAGESAGGNLVASLAVASCWRFDAPWTEQVWEAPVRPRAILGYCGVYQVSDSDRWRRNAKVPWWQVAIMRDLEDCYLPEAPVPELSPLVDPLMALERYTAPERPLMPFFLPVGTKDPLIADTRRLEAALQDAGCPVEARYYDGQPHAFHAFLWRKRARACWRDSFDFLQRHV